MAPTTAADRMLVISSMTSSLDWILTRDITLRGSLRFGAASDTAGLLSGSVVVVIESQRLACETGRRNA